MSTCNATALVTLAAQEVFSSLAAISDGCVGASSLPPPTSYERLALARAQAAAGAAPAAAAALTALFLAQQSDGRMPHLVYDAPSCAAAGWPPLAVWGNGSGAASGLAAPPAHASAVLSVFQAWYTLADGSGDDGAVSTAQRAASVWLRSVWDALLTWHRWLLLHRGLTPPWVSRRRPRLRLPAPSLLLSLSPFESSTPWGAGWQRGLERAGAAGSRDGCAMAASALAAPPDAVIWGAAFPGNASFGASWCQTGW